MAWISWSKLYERDTKRWYCISCDKRTRIEVNAAWDNDGRPRSWDEPDKYEWITRCTDCKYEHFIGGYNCPCCGCGIGEQKPLEYGERRYNSYYSYEFGVTGYDWEELHQCRKCRTKFWISNSTC